MHKIRKHSRVYEWHEIRHRIYTLRKLRWGLWQLVDQNRRIVEEGSQKDCRLAMSRLAAPQVTHPSPIDYMPYFHAERR